MSIYARHYNTKQTPQSRKIPGSSQVKNSAGGYSFKVDDWTRLDRFLVLGTEGGSYYASEQKLTVQNAEAVMRCIKADGVRTVQRIVLISDEGRAPKNDPAIFALAMCLKQGDLDTRRAASAAVPKVCRIGTHIFQFAEALQAFGGWGRLTAKAVAGYYNSKSADRLALDLFKYQSRNGWSHKDLLLKAHVGKHDQDKAHQALYRYIVAEGSLGKREVIRASKDGKVLSEASYKRLSKRDLPRLVEGVEKAKASSSPKETAKLIVEYGLPRECVKTEHLNDLAVWDALLTSGQGMPLTAMIRNLGKMSSIGLTSPMSAASKYVVSRLRDAGAIQKARVHPMAILMALRTYEQGHGLKGSLTWKTDQNIVSALDKAFYLAFKAVEPTNQNWLLALDVSGSMGATIAGTPLSAREASAAMALVTMNVEPAYHCIGFTSGGHGRGFYSHPGTRSMWGGASGVSELNLHDRMSLRDAVAATSSLPFGGTDCALPMLYATTNKLEVDTFVVYTDSETWAGNVHPVQALREYRQKMGRPAKLIVVGMCSNGFSIADPSDGGMLDVVGFDTAAPNIMASFARND